jgi:hypothetical protein
MTKDQIFVAVGSSEIPQSSFEYARKIAEAYEKEICIVPIADNCKSEHLACELQQTNNIKINYLENNILPIFTETIEKHEASMIIFELSNQKPLNNIAFLLKICRDLRVPYIFTKQTFSNIQFDKILVPVSFLVEEKEKGPFASGFGRFLKSEILLMPANDYGSKARNNCNAIRTLLEKFEIKNQEIKAKKDSYKVEMEATQRSKEIGAGVVLVTASREYGLDDIIFGPKELHIIKKAEIPVVLLNPRGDLYVLCG